MEGSAGIQAMPGHGLVLHGHARRFSLTDKDDELLCVHRPMPLTMTLPEVLVDAFAAGRNRAGQYLSLALRAELQFLNTATFRHDLTGADRWQTAQHRDRIPVAT